MNQNIIEQNNKKKFIDIKKCDSNNTSNVNNLNKKSENQDEENEKNIVCGTSKSDDNSDINSINISENNKIKRNYVRCCCHINLENFCDDREKILKLVCNDVLINADNDDQLHKTENSDSISSFIKIIINKDHNNDEENDKKSLEIDNETTNKKTSKIFKKNVEEKDLRQLILELQNKIDQNERMNWLYLSKRPMGVPHRKTSLPKHTDVKKHFLEICDITLADEVKSALRLPAFDSYQWDDAEVLQLMQTMFIELGLLTKLKIPTSLLREFLYEVYKHYNEVPFHNFRHCFCVAQMMYAITWRTDLINRLGELEVMILLVSCICHDLDHPGYNNIYQINARTELALRYNDISPLENHHCSIAFRLLEHPDCNIFKGFSKEIYKDIREGIIRCILATDMARHNEILDQFKEITPTFDYSNKAHRNLLCMVLIKVADISNEARPMDVAEPWLDRLLQEFFAQSALEKSEGLPVTPFMDPDKVSKPGSQVRFIGLVLLPLFEALGELLTELNDFIINPVRVALDYYRRLNDAQTKIRKSMVEENCSESSSPQLPRSQSGLSVRSRKSIPSQKSTSRTSVDEQSGLPVELHDLPEGSESGDSETATEVECAEQTSKFKVDTEGSSRSKLSHPGSRKGSREKRPSMCGEYYMSSSGRMVRGSHGNIHAYHSSRNNFGANRAVSLDQYGTNNRRMSEGLPAVTSDTQVFYNQFHHHLHAHNQPSFQSHYQNNSSETDGTTNSSADGKLYEEDCENMNESLTKIDEKSNFNSNPIISNNSNLPITEAKNQTNKYQTTTRDGAPKSFFSRFRQLTGRLSFSFDKEARRNSSNSNNSPSKNNNAEVSKSSGFCCSISSSHSPNLKHSTDFARTGNTARNRAYSLDVPSNRNRYSGSSGDGSRKSSTSTKNDETNNQKCGISITVDHDDSSYNNKDTTSGDGGNSGGVGGCNI